MREVRYKKVLRAGTVYYVKCDTGGNYHILKVESEEDVIKVISATTVDVGELKEW
jgi:hypothetical protein